jgi:hypothetical protein
METELEVDNNISKSEKDREAFAKAMYDIMKDPTFNFVQEFIENLDDENSCIYKVDYFRRISIKFSIYKDGRGYHKVVIEQTCLMEDKNTTTLFQGKIHTLHVSKYLPIIIICAQPL